MMNNDVGGGGGAGGGGVASAAGDAASMEGFKLESLSRLQVCGLTWLVAFL